MADYIADVRLQLRIKNVKDEYDAMQYAEQFLFEGLADLAYSDDENDDHYEIESVSFLELDKTY